MLTQQNGAGGGRRERVPSSCLVQSQKGLWRCQHLSQVSGFLGGGVLSDLEPASCWPLMSHLGRVALEGAAVRSRVHLGEWKTLTRGSAVER